MIPITAVADRLIKDIKEDDLTTKEIQDRVHTLAKKALAQAESEDSTEICNRLKHLIDTLKENYNFATRDDFITQVIDKVIQTCNTLSSENQLAPSLPAEAFFTVIDHLPFSTKSDVEKVVAILKEIEPKGKPPPDVKNYHKHLMDSFIKKVNESAVSLKYFDEETLKWLVHKLSHLNLIGLKTSEFLYAFRPQKATAYSISATEFAELSRERQEEIVLKIVHFDLKKIQAYRFNEMLHKAVNAKTYSIDAKNLAGFSVEQISKIAPKITDLNISDGDLSDEQFASLIENCINLRHLEIRTNATSLPDSWPFIEQLETLDCSDCHNLKKLPDNMPQLRELNCGHCPIKSLPGNMPELRKLNCFDCFDLKNLPDNMQELRKLRCMWCPDLKKLPNNMPELRLLDCSDSSIQSLPKNMPQLEALDCSSCPIQSLPDNMPKLEELYCNWCPVESLPGNMPQLRELDCFGCSNLKKLPVTMPQLRELDCCRCPRLSEINVPSGCAVQR